MAKQDGPNGPTGAVDAVLRRLGEALGAVGWRLEGLGKHDTPLRLCRGKQRLLLEVRHALESRRPILKALLADAILSGRAKAGHGERVLALVIAPAISKATAGALDAYAAEVAPGQPFGYADERGYVRLRGGELDQVKREATEVGEGPPAAARPRDLFSDVNQWLLKVLLAGEVSENLISVPRWTGGSAAELSRMARVSLPAAWRIQTGLRASGHLGDKGRAVRVVDLLARWRAAVERPQAEIAAVWTLPGRSPLERFKRQLADQPEGSEPIACLGLFSACESLGLGHVRGAPTHLYVRKSQLKHLEQLGLVPAERGQPGDVVVRVARWPEATFRSVVRPEGVPVADVLQCWLDVSVHPARGAEQAAFLWKRVLGQALTGGGPQP